MTLDEALELAMNAINDLPSGPSGQEVVALIRAGAWDRGMTFSAGLLNAEELTPSFRKDNPYRQELR